MTAPPLLLDLDGTVIATRQLYIEALSRAMAPHLGWHLSEDEIIARHPKAEVRFLREMVGDEALPTALEVFYREYEALHGELFRGVYAGMGEVLDELRGRGVRLALVTGKSRAAWDITLRNLHLGDFHALVFDDDVVQGKPHPEGLMRALEVLEYAAVHTPDGGAPGSPPLYVGDSVSDLDAAVAAGLRPAGTLWSKRTGERDAFAEAVEVRGGVLLRTPADLLELV